GDTRVHALRGIDMEIKQGEFLSIAGPSGSGKSTLLNLIGCIDDIDAGEIIIQDKTVSSMSASELVALRRANIGFIFQTFNLIPVLSAYENVAMVMSLLNLPKDQIRQETMQLLSDVGLQGMEHRRPAKLSGGQQQRVAIARALIKKPLIVLADEPTANLDSETGESVLKIMKQINESRGTTFLFSTHDPMVMDFADRLCNLHDGKIISDSMNKGKKGGDNA
ncbi:MAG: ABC transporter ATP-binding protein, partial [Spirochaetaceae bacterium]